MKRMGAKSVGILYNDAPFATSITSEVASQCAEAELDLVGREKFKSDAVDVTPQLSKLRSGDPDVLMVSAYGAGSGYILQGLDRRGWKVPVRGDNAFMISKVIVTPQPQGMLGTSLEDNVKAEVFQSTVYRAPGEQPKALTNMIAKMKATKAIPAPLIVAYMYDAIVLAAAGAEAAGTTTDGPAIAKAIEKLPAGGPQTAVFPAYNFSASSHSANVDAEAFIFTKPSKVIDGQFGAPGSS